MGFVKDVFGGAKNAIGKAPVNDFKAQNQVLTDEERQRYAEKVAMAQSGQMPSAADAMVKAAQDRATANAMAMANSARGGVNPALLQRMAMRQGAEQQQAIAQQGAQAKAQESLGLINLYEQLGMQGDVANLGSRNAAQGINAGVAQGNQQTQGQFGMTGMQQQGQAVGGLMSGIGAVAASDENLKKDIQGGDSAIREFLDALKAHKYSYKDKKFGEGEFISPLAQELEKTPVGESMVEDTSEGKMVNYGKGFGAVLAAQAHLNERLSKLEKKKNG